MKRVLKITFFLLTCLMPLVALCSCLSPKPEPTPTPTPTPPHTHVFSYEEQELVEPTCVQSGTYSNVAYCDCGYELNRTTIEVIPPTGSHDYDYDGELLSCKICTTLLDYTSSVSYELSEDETYIIITGIEEGLVITSDYGIVIPSEIGHKPVKEISYGAFSELKNLVHILIPESVTTIGNAAFYGCSSLTSIEIPNGVKIIEDSTFSGCSKLTSVTIPESVTSIGSYAFDGCAIKRVYITNIAKWCEIDFNTHLLSDGESWALYLNNEHVTNLVIPDGVTSIGESAFACCRTLKSVAIPDSVTSIGEYAFYYCSSLTSIVIPDSVKSIGYHAFSGCSSLESIVIPDSVTSIGNGAFSGCSSLTSIVIPNSVTSIGYYAFSGCSSLANIVIPDSVTYIGSGVLSDTAFYNNPENWQSGVLYSGNHLIAAENNILGALEIKPGTITISPSAFYECSSITKLTIPESVIFIGHDAFSGCSSLTSIVIHNGVTSIGNEAFYGCSALEDVYYTGSEENWAKISIGSNNNYLTGATIHYDYVPEK